eukprot:TRINITY_DN70662_c0_g1_i1.p1 TRINITY_DN70662_c0_g1~~TRINITY_DN70662_c0_g1_i1.p1  ORF type:complete len:549 (+),score=172.15 TRINITY_DN70662_c0_g1_i1:82-1728(+)
MKKDQRLTADEFNLLSEAFNHHVVQNGFGRIDDAWKLRNVLQACGQTPTDEDIARMLPPGGGWIEFDDFVRMMEAEKAKQLRPPPPDSDTIEAFVAMGGGSKDDGDTKGGEVQAELLRHMVHNFGLTLDIDKLIAEVDTDGSGEISFDEFAEMFRTQEELDQRNARGGGRREKRMSTHLNRKAAAKVAALAPAKAPSPQAKQAPSNATVQIQQVDTAGDYDYDSDASSTGSVGVPRRVGGTMGFAPERKVCVVASGAKKTSAHRSMTRDQLLEFKMRRLERNIKRTGELGGEIPAVPAVRPHSRRNLRAAAARHNTAADTLDADSRGESMSPSQKAKQKQQQQLKGPAARRAAMLRHCTEDVTLTLEPAPYDECPPQLVWRAGQPRQRSYLGRAHGISPSIKAATGRRGSANLEDRGSRSKCFGMAAVRERLQTPAALLRPSSPAELGWVYTGMEDPSHGLPPPAFSPEAVSPHGVVSAHRRILSRLLAVPDEVFRGARPVGAAHLGRQPGLTSGLGTRVSHAALHDLLADRPRLKTPQSLGPRAASA